MPSPGGSGSGLPRRLPNDTPPLGRLNGERVTVGDAEQQREEEAKAEVA